MARLPEGTETRLTEEVQSQLPKGFQQALAFAQAIIQRPRVLVLDEPARTLDRDLEKAMMASLQRRRGEITIVMITHRPSHVKMADFEITMDNGMLFDTRSARRIA